MKKTRKQPALAKCVLATIMAMGMMGYTTVWADTPTPLLIRMYLKMPTDRFMMLPIIINRVTSGLI